MSVAVIKLGGSVLTGLDAYRRAAAALRAGLASEQAERATLVVVVSAQLGVTDHDLALARSIALDPDPRALDLLGPRASSAPWRCSRLPCSAKESRRSVSTCTRQVYAYLELRGQGPEARNQGPEATRLKSMHYR